MTEPALSQPAMLGRSMSTTKTTRLLFFSSIALGILCPANLYAAAGASPPVTRRGPVAPPEMLLKVTNTPGNMVAPNANASMGSESAFELDSGPPPNCDLSLQLIGFEAGRYRKSAGKLADYNQRYAVVASQSVCLKPKGSETIEIPKSSSFKLHFAETRRQRDSDNDQRHAGLCTHGTIRKLNGDKVTIRRDEDDPRTLRQCDWNGHFRDEIPFDFILRSSSQASIDKHVREVSVHLNGKQVYARSVQTSPNDDNRALIVPGTGLRRRYTPNQAQFSFRLLPVISIAKSSMVLASAESTRRSAWQNLRRSSSALFSNVESSALNKLPTLGCALHAMASLQERAEELSGAKNPTSGLRSFLSKWSRSDADCDTEPITALPAFDIQRTVDELAKSSSQQLVQKSEESRHAIQSYLDSVSAREIPSLLSATALAKLEEEWGSLPDDNPLKQRFASYAELLESVEKLAQSTLSTARTTLQSIDAIVADLRRIRTDSEAQLQIYEKFASRLSLDKRFDSYKANPPSRPGEVELGSHYTDPFQFYYFGAWSGSSSPIYNLDVLRWNIDATVAVPIVDVLGFRVQFGDTRFAEVRAGIGFAMFRDRYTEEVLELLSDDDNPLPTHTAQWAPQLNLGISTFRIGLAVAMREAPNKLDRRMKEGSTSFAKRVRIVIGVDLVKLVSGTNFELFTN